ncbi:MAG TPA: hypothetical protein VKR83_14390 [Ktedonobacteraceae bacterium]|nr:hypothetical protein [Ktedonobacteraceae bacterium]
MNYDGSMYFGIPMSEQKDARMFPPVPMVYETLPQQPLNWEYHVLSIDPRETALPDTAELNELGNAGWLLVGVAREGERGKVYYYFVRQKRA